MSLKSFYETDNPYSECEVELLFINQENALKKKTSLQIAMKRNSTRFNILPFKRFLVHLKFFIKIYWTTLICDFLCRVVHEECFIKIKNRGSQGVGEHALICVTLRPRIFLSLMINYSKKTRSYTSFFYKKINQGILRAMSHVPIE